MRAIATVLHRWAGLITAAFLVFSGLTGAVISWDHELDELLNPHLHDARADVAPSGPARDALALAREIEARHPQVQVTYVPLAAEPGHSYAFGVEPRVNPTTQRLYEPGFNQVFVDPASGKELGKREWGAVWPITRETFVSFLYKLHYSLHFPEIAGTDQWGIWLLGIIAMIWTIDCFVGFILTLPARRRVQDAVASRSFWQRWKPAWKVRTRGGAYKLNFDLHRAFSLWTWLLLFIIAFTAFSLNLYREVFFPAMSLVSNVTPSPFDLREPRGKHEPISPVLDFGGALQAASVEARSRGWTKPAGSIFYAREYGIYGVAFYRPEENHGAGGVGHQELYLDAQDGRVLGDREPWKGTAADIFVQAQFPLHSGRILGLPGRILISIMGVVVAMLAMTGVVIWWRKRRARALSPAAASAGRGASAQQPAEML
ncbi:MAG: PepSY-associated TM helix domain-containing protein [Burkholderiaceae bacterium]